MDIKNKLTVATGEAGGGLRGGGGGEGSSRKMCKGPMDKDNGEG